MGEVKERRSIAKAEARRASAGDMPYLAALAAEVTQRRSGGEMLTLSHFKPDEVISDQLVRRTLETTLAYITTYVSELARQDVEAARYLSDHLSVPWVRVLETRDGRMKPIVIVASLSEYFRATNAELGELAGTRSLRYVREKSNSVRTQPKPVMPA